MDWITQEQAAEAAEQGELEALECSLEHHEQGRDSDWIELKETIENDKFCLSWELCACCRFVGKQDGFKDNGCRKCPLGDFFCWDNIIWAKVGNSWAKLINSFSNANFKAFQEVEAELCTYIKRVIEKVKAKECEKCEKYEPELEGFVCGWFNRVSVQKTEEDTVKVSVFGWGDNAHPTGAPAQAWNFSMNELADFYQKLGKLLAKQEKSKCWPKPIL